MAVRDAEVAQLRQALASRIWIEQAKGVLAATQGTNADDAFQQLRKRARSSSRKVADLAQEVVQAAQRERIAALAIDDARVRAAEARAREAEQALQAAQTGLAQRTAALDRAQDDAESLRCLRNAERDGVIELDGGSRLRDWTRQRDRDCLPHASSKRLKRDRGCREMLIRLGD